MRKLSLTAVMALVLTLSAFTLNRPVPVAASPADFYSAAAPYFGAGNLPPGCENDALVGTLELRALSTFQDPKSLNNVCHHMRTDMNALDSPQVDVLVMVPASPTAERDMRIMRQSVEMWEGGIDYLAEEMGLGWLAQGMDFHVTVDAFDPAGDGGGEFTTYPIVDPEIVVVAANPLVVGYAGIGIDPVDSVFVNEDQLGCHGVSNPFNFEAWENLPGFNSHHETRSGTYVQDCGPDAGGGNICFAVNGGADTPVVDLSSLFDLVSHEFGHCLTIGHVGDGAEGKWGATPTNDIMAYHSDPPGLSKCVSTLDVEGVALRMSKYLDVNGDGAVSPADQLFANDAVGQGENDFQVQHPDDHLYASSTGSPTDCPQPDTGITPGPRVDWTPTPLRITEPVLSVTGPLDGTTSNDGVFTVTGTVEHAAINHDPTEPTAYVRDSENDATSSITEIKQLDVEVTATHIDATISLADLWPSTALASPVSYSVTIDDRKFDSFIRYAIDPNPMTWDTVAAKYLPAGSSTWDLTAKTVSFHIPRTSYLAQGSPQVTVDLAGSGMVSPYFVGSSTNFGLLSTSVEDDTAPDSGESVGVAGPANASVGLPGLPGGANAAVTTFVHEGANGNTFYPEDSSLGSDRGTSHTFTLDIPVSSDVDFDLSWTDGVGGSDIDLFITGAADSGSTGASPNSGLNTVEKVTLEDVVGMLNIEVDPYFVTDALSGSTYTLTANVKTDSDLDGIFDHVDACPTEPGVAPTGCPDGDGDGVIDADDVCPAAAGDGADGCPIASTEQVQLLIGGAVAATQAVDTANGADSFGLTVGLAEGTHTVLVVWEDGGEVIASKTLTLTHNTDDDGDGVVNEADACPGFDDFDDLDHDGVADGCDTDSDGDRVADHRDNCRNVSNPDQSNIDGDARGDVCDADKDGDGHSNDKEISHGTDPADPNSYPGKPKAGVIGF